MNPLNSGKTRLDILLVTRGFFESRARATAAIKAGHVKVNGKVVTRTAHATEEEADINVSGAGHNFVSRGGLKLAHGLDAFGYNPEGKCAIDLGASTGGFTDVLLKRGAAHVYAVDVGHDQLHPDLRGHPCVTNLEGVNARGLTRDQIGLRAKHPLNCLVCDVSFIRLSLVLPPAMSLLVSGGWMVALIKPQFEAGRAAIGKNGVVSDPGVHARVCDDFAAWFAETFPDWQGHEIVPSPIVGPQGNKEFLFGARAPDYKSDA